MNFELENFEFWVLDFVFEQEMEFAFKILDFELRTLNFELWIINYEFWCLDF